MFTASINVNIKQGTFSSHRSTNGGSPQWFLQSKVHGCWPSLEEAGWRQEGTRKCLNFNWGCEWTVLMQGRSRASIASPRCCSRKWLSLRRLWPRRTSSYIPVEWLSSFERTTYVALRRKSRREEAVCPTVTLRLWLTSSKMRLKS